MNKQPQTIILGMRATTLFNIGKFSIALLSIAMVLGLIVTPSQLHDALLIVFMISFLACAILVHLVIAKAPELQKDE